MPQPKRLSREDGRLGRRRRPPKEAVNGNAIERTDPEAAAAFMAQRAEHPEVPLTELAASCGLPEPTARALAERMETHYQPVVSKLRRVTVKSLVEKLETLQDAILDSFTLEDIHKASLRDRAITFGVLVDKGLLLNGQPTQIVSFGERETFSELVRQVLKEASKRGITIDADWTEVPTVRALPGASVE